MRQLFLDLDGVLGDFDSYFESTFGHPARNFEEKHGENIDVCSHMGKVMGALMVCVVRTIMGLGAEEGDAQKGLQAFFHDTSVTLKRLYELERE